LQYKDRSAVADPIQRLHKRPQAGQKARKKRKKLATKPWQLPGLARSERFPQDQGQIERGSLHQQSLQNVVPAPQMNSSHATGVVHLGKASFGQFAAYLLQPLTAIASYSPPVPVRPLLLDALPSQ
jgi:hypothetical protein